MDRYVRGLGGEMKIVAEFPDGTQARIPITHGKPVRSRVTAEPSRAGEDAKPRRTRATATPR
jgi:hypothetical protein